MTTASTLIHPAFALRLIPDVLAAVRETPSPTERVLSVYLDTAPPRVAGEAYLLAYRDACKALRKTLPEFERAAFEAAATQAEQFLTSEFLPGHPGLAFFASGRPEYRFAAPLPERPQDAIVWGTRADVAPLQAALDEFERVAVALFDQARARLFTLYLGEVEASRVIESEVPGKQATGEWFALAQARYARHREDHVLRHARRTVAGLMEMLRASPFDRLLLGGPPEALAVLRRHLPRPLRHRFAGVLQVELFASDAEVVRTALWAAAELERRADVGAVEELLEAATSDHAAVGVEATLAAIAEGRVHLLLIAGSLPSEGVECAACGRLWAGGERCPACGGAVAPVADLGERAVEGALGQGARVETVAGEAAERLRQQGSIGAWLRF